ncbi:hypothetical protein BO94DRAFT_545836 [Aspergillus sclerotioniger CBS 115572]|uniref:Uncharacterized protein n=1 Tax=Aspergillus sclerotioniger CBS 115572 TaxID=1450535 RepID=A0A317WTZ8_9EURO|nr:hypothetical protein BO94DRAFT_545836 [Aspergillus sclerotioniger CBS 115572]PWY88752.1 hypothetical protein BO94DRAFT_545836 [Aspergillus sclerotioniger CBS 115572]
MATADFFTFLLFVILMIFLLSTPSPPRISIWQMDWLHHPDINYGKGVGRICLPARDVKRSVEMGIPSTSKTLGRDQRLGELTLPPKILQHKPEDDSEGDAGTFN